MNRKIGTNRIVVASMVLMGAALGMFGDVKLAATNQVHPRVSRTEREQMAGVKKDDAAPAMVQGVSVVARGRSSETDPCIPTAPVTFFPRVAVVC